MTLEDEFGEMPDDKIEDFHTVGDVVRYIEEKHLSFRFAKAPKPWGLLLSGCGRVSALPHAAELFCKENAV